MSPRIWRCAWRGKLCLPVECDHGIAVDTPVGRFREVYRFLVLDAEDARERRFQPSPRDLLREAQSIRWIGESDIEFTGRQPADELDRVAVVENGLRLHSEGMQVLLQQLEALVALFHEN